MSKQQRLILLCIVALIIGFGLIQNNHRSFECYILRSQDGVTFVADEEPVFTDADVASYDDITHTFTFTEAYISKMKNGKLFKERYLDSTGGIIDAEDYWIAGISALGARYPDRFMIMIDGDLVLEGYFETPAIMSFLPPGRYIRTNEDGITIEMGYVAPIDSLAKDDSVGFDKIQDYFQ